MLKMNEIKLKKINDVNVHLFIEKRMRKGISYILKRYSKNDDTNTTMYWDPNNLYEWAMTQPLPVSDFKFLSEKEIDRFKLVSIDENSSIGYILECDLGYCKKLHDSHNVYPLCPEKIEVSSGMLSKYCSDIANKYGIKADRVKKLIPNVSNKVKYVVHYRNLQYYLSLGIRLIKVHRILKFKQSSWLKEYVVSNTRKRQESTDELNKAFLKLLINCVYGKSVENIRKRINVKLINDSKEASQTS